MTRAEETLASLLTPARLARWAARRAERDDRALRAVWRAFVARGGPVSLDTVGAALPGWPAAAVEAAVVALDRQDLLVLEDRAVRVAYPFDTGPTPFPVTVPAGGDRYACCAIDALGIAPMIGAPTRVRARCHRSGAAVDLAVDPARGPESFPAEARSWRVWVEAGAWSGPRLSGGL